MSTVKYALSLAGIFVVSSAARWLVPQEMAPFDLFLVAVVFVALFRGPMATQLFALAAGLTQDIFGGQIIGISALSKTVTAFSIASLSNVVLIKGTPQRAVTFILASIADVLLRGAVSMAFSLPFTVDLLALSTRALVNAVIGTAAVLLLRRRMEGRRKVGGYEVA